MFKVEGSEALTSPLVRYYFCNLLDSVTVNYNILPHQSSPRLSQELRPSFESGKALARVAGRLPYLIILVLPVERF